MAAEELMKIVLGVAGSIAAYKSPDLVRRLREVGADVRVVLSDGGRAFITPLSLQAVSGYPVVYDLLDPAHEAGMGHIELSRWADLILIAPASANTIAKLAHGFASDLLSAICLAAECPIILAPGMNRLMWDNPATKSNLALLKSRGIIVMEPGRGSQACGEIGQGRMPEPLEIRDFVQSFLQERKERESGPLRGKSVVITAGPTVEEIDPVRYISNYSSGKMGYSLAEACRNAGAEVTLISGPVVLTVPTGVTFIAVKTAKEMMEAAWKATRKADLFIAAAAVADYHVANPAEQKLKKTDDSNEMTITLKKNPDILATISLGDDRPLCIGFAAETHDILRHAKEKLERKGLDMICLNDVSGGKVFGKEENELIIIHKNGEEVPVPKGMKADVAEIIVHEVLKLF